MRGLAGAFARARSVGAVGGDADVDVTQLGALAACACTHAPRAMQRRAVPPQ